MIVLLMLVSTGALMAQNAPGRLPWGPTGEDSGSSKAKKDSNGLTTQAETTSSELFRHLDGVVSYSVDSLHENTFRSTRQDFSLSVRSRGFLFDPRLWYQSVTFRFDHTGGSNGTGRGIGIHYEGWLLRRRSFPLHLYFTRGNSDTTAPLFKGQNTYLFEGFDWSLRKPRLVNIGISGYKHNQSQEDVEFPAPGQAAGLAPPPVIDHSKALSVHLDRNLLGWQFTSDGNYSNSHSSLLDLQTIWKDERAQVRKRFLIGSRGEFSPMARYWWHDQSQNKGAKTSSSLFVANATFSYRHTKKLDGSYGVSYSSNTAESVLSAALLSSQGSGGSVNTSPGALLAAANRSGSSVGFNGAWSYQATRRLTLRGYVGRELFNRNGMSDSQIGILKNHTRAGGGAVYRRRFGRWGTAFYASLTQAWYRYANQAGATDVSHSIGFDWTRKFGRWDWDSDISYWTNNYRGVSPYRSTTQSWRTGLHTKLNSRVRLNIQGIVLHVKTNSASLFAANNAQSTGVTAHGTLASSRWNVDGGTGFSNLDSAYLPLDLSNPLNVLLLKQSPSLSTFITTTDHYYYLTGGYRVGERWSVHASYRNDSLDTTRGSFKHITNLDTSVRYRLRKTYVLAGYQREEWQTAGGPQVFNRVYFQIRRPFRIF